MKAEPQQFITSGLKHGKIIDPELKVWNSNGEWFPKLIGEGIFKLSDKCLRKSLLAELSSRSAKKNVLGK